MINIDLHVHSKYSKRPSQWVLQKLGCPESFTEPIQIYRIAKSRGMNLVTITDHNAISGALEIAHFPDAFISEEITSYFPDDGCKVHVLAYDINERQHEDIQRARNSVFELTDYLNKESIVHALAHPLYGVNDSLKVDHVEQMILLFKTFELNGARNNRQNIFLKSLLSALTFDDFFILSEKYGIEPLFPTPWKKGFIGGSDDHSGLNIARTYTTVMGANSAAEMLKGITRTLGDVKSDHPTPLTMAHNLYGIAYQFYRNKFNLGQHIHKDMFLGFLDRFLLPDSESQKGIMAKLYYLLNYRKCGKGKAEVGAPLLDLIRRETGKLLRENPDLMEAPEESNNSPDEREKRWFDFVNRVSEKLLSETSNHLFGHLSGANLFNIFQTVGSSGGLYSLLLPYFVSFSQFTRDLHFMESARDHFSGLGFEMEDKGSKKMKVAHFTDTFYDINGVALTLRQLAEIAEKSGKQMTIMTCDPEKHEEKGSIKNFDPIGVYEVPEYNDQKISYPPFLEILNHCYEQGFTHIHSATPGPMGLVAMAVSNILKLPFSGTYHTAFPQYARYLTGDNMIEEMMWKFIIWYYDSMDSIYVSSISSGEELAAKGIRNDKIRIISRGIDTNAFHPNKRNGFYGKRYSINNKVKLIYVGRVSREKNLHKLAGAFKKLARDQKDIHLIIVGDGPYIGEMKEDMKEAPCTFTGYLKGEDLARAYASGDIFVFPSTTDTFGNVVLEAQASGLPTIVTDQGGPCENIINGETGLVVKGGDEEGLAEAMARLIRDGGLRENMGRSARKYMEDRSFERAFYQSWELFREIPTPMSHSFPKAG